MGCAEKGGGAWEFRATYVCIELRLGAYPFQKFRRYHGVRKKLKKDGRVKYEPVVSLNGVKIYFQEQETIEQAALIRDVAMFCLDINGRHGFNFHEDLYFSLSKISNKLPRDQIKDLILQYAKGLPTWKHMTTNASPLHPSNIPNEDATMVGFDEFLRELCEEPLQLSFDNQSQEVDVEGGVEDINGDSTTLHGVEHEMISELMNDLDVPVLNLQQNAHQLREETSQHPNALDNEILQPSSNQSPIQQLTCRLEIGMPCGIEESTNLTMEILNKLQIFVKAGWGLSLGNEKHSLQSYKKFTLEKFGDNEARRLSPEMFSILTYFYSHGWTIKW